VAAPFGRYSHAVEVPEGSGLLYISGEVGVLPDGTVPEGVEAQAEACWRNIIVILADTGMEVGDLVKITTYLVRPEDVAAAGAVRCGRNILAMPVPVRRRSSSKRSSGQSG
jgi:enamine deaminase RidA (YjgF/YER057c/UK114 family)